MISARRAPPRPRWPPPAAPATGQIGLVLADAGYLSEHNLTCPGPDRLIATGKRRDLEEAARAGDAGARPAPAGQQAAAIAAMTARLATEDGIAAYRRRSHIGETFHGDLKHNKGIRRLSVRGLPRASGEWTFATAVRNLRKAITSGHLTPRPSPPSPASPRQEPASAGTPAAIQDTTAMPASYSTPVTAPPAQDDSGTAPMTL